MSASTIVLQYTNHHFFSLNTVSGVVESIVLAEK